MTRCCTLCGEVRPLEQFYANALCREGRASQCIPCVKAKARVRHAGKKEAIRAYDRERAKLPHRMMARAARIIREREANPERQVARTAVNNAVRDGKLRQMDCAFCGDGKTIAHHHDYATPLDVTWLCQPCHHRYHALERMAASAQVPA